MLYTEEFRSYPLAAWLEQFGEASPRPMRADSVDLARTMIAAGSGIGVLWCCHGDALATLERVLPQQRSVTRCCVVYHRSLRGTTRVKAVADLLVEHLATHRDLLSGHGPAAREPVLQAGSRRTGQR